MSEKFNEKEREVYSAYLECMCFLLAIAFKNVKWKVVLTEQNCDFQGPVEDKFQIN